MQHTSGAAPLSPAPPPSFLRRFRFPIIVLIITAGIFAIPWILIALHLEAEGPMPLFMAIQSFPAAGAFLIGLWFLFFSPFRWKTRLAGLVVALVVIVGFVLSIREVELTKGRIALVPRFHFIWEPTANEQLAVYLEKTGAPGDLPPIDAKIGPEDFPHYRGVHFDGVVPFATLETDWTKHPPRALWRHPCAGGYSGMAVAGNIVVTLEQRDTGEAVVCYDRDTGRQRWAHVYAANYKDAAHMGDGPRSTPTIHAEHIYALGASGDLICLTAQGTRQWATNVLRDAKAKNIKWGLTGSPLIVDDLVVAHAGIDESAPANSALIAYEQAGGSIRWRTGNRKAGYSSPQLATLAGKAQIILFDGGGLVSYDPKTGAELWQYPWITDYEMNSIQPVIVGDDRIFISSEISNGCALLRVGAPDSAISPTWTVTTLWQNKNLGARYANPVTDGKNIFGLSALQGVLTCLDVGTGKVRWKGDREGPGQLLLTGHQLLVLNGDRGELALFEAEPASCKELARFPVLDDKTWNTPALAGDQLFVRNQSTIACLKLPRK